MAYLKPQAPLKDINSGDYFYPLTTIDQLITGSSRLSAYFSETNNQLSLNNINSISSGGVLTVLNNMIVTGDVTINGASTLTGGVTIYGLSRAVTSTYSIPVSSNWQETSIPYTATISIPGMNSTYKPIISMFRPTTENAANYKSMWKAYGCIDKAVSDTDKIIFYCYNKKPASDIIVQVKVI